MASGIWTAASGATLQSQSLDMIANNLANVDTAAYKKDLPTFKEYLATTERSKSTQDIPKGPFKDKDFYPLDGRDQSYVVLDGTHTSHRQGNLRVTQGPLDLALDGPGFFEVSTPGGIRFTRNGSFKMGADGRLLTQEGYPVLASQAVGLAGANALNRNDVASRFINLKDVGARVTINQQGEIYAGEERVAQLSLVEIQNLNHLKRSGGQLFESIDPNPGTQAQMTLLRQGVLETSNVNPIEEMTNMIRTNRLFEQDLKAMKTFGELMGKEVNEVGKL